MVRRPVPGPAPHPAPSRSTPRGSGSTGRRLCVLHEGPTYLQYSRPSSVAPRPRAVHAKHHRSIDERPRPLGLRRASDLRSARPASVSDVVTPESSSSHEQHMMLRCRKAEGPADLHDRRGLPVMRCSDHCGPQRLVASRSRISVSSSTSVTSLASSAAFCLARRSLSLFIGRTMAK